MRIAIGGLLAMAAGMGIGRFVYTPNLPDMIVGLHWSKLDAGLVASANFLGYLVGALAAGLPAVAARPRAWLFAGLAVSSLTTLFMAAFTDLAVLGTLRLIGGVSSAFVIICGSAIVLERLAVDGQARLAAVHFAGVGVRNRCVGHDGRTVISLGRTLDDPLDDHRLDCCYRVSPGCRSGPQTGLVD